MSADVVPLSNIGVEMQQCELNAFSSFKADFCQNHIH